jgi:hypothetical protein
MPLYEVAILELPTDKEEEEGKEESLVFGPKPVIAADPQSAAIRAILEDPEKAKEINKARIKVLVRHFG